MRSALDGLSVLEIGEGTAVRYCGKLFADLGADVVSIESTGAERGRDGAHLHLNTNKRSVLADPSDAEGRSLVAALAERADLVIESHDGPAHADLSAWDVDRNVLRNVRPSLSVVHLSAFGCTGPYATFRGADIAVQAMASSFWRGASTIRVPVRLPADVAECFFGHVAAVGALAAVMSAARDGRGSFVDCSELEALSSVPMRQANLLGYQYRGRKPLPPEVTASTNTLIPNGVFPCADGYVALMSTSQQLQQMLKVLDDPAATKAFEHPDAFNRPETKEALDVALYTWLTSHTRAEATALAQAAGWPLAPVNSLPEALGADHLHQRGFWTHSDDPRHGPIDLPGPWCRFGEGGWALRRIAPGPGRDTASVRDRVRNGRAAAPAPAGAPTRTGPIGTPLAGIRVVDLTVVWSGPYATLFLADLGAEVIRVENPFVLPPTTKGYHPRPVLANPGPLGSLYGPARPGAPDRPWNRHALNNSIARNKLSVTIDIGRDEGRELLMRLADVSDVFIDNFRADTLDHLKIDVSELRRRNPRLVVVRLPPAGLTGDWSPYKGFGAQFDGLSGFLSLLGHEDSDPTDTPPTTHMDASTGPAGAMAVLAALRYRDATGRGQFVELSQTENIINHLGADYVDCQLGRQPRRWGNRHPEFAPQGLYRCAGDDRWIALSVRDDEELASLATVIGDPRLADDPRFATAQGRRNHHDELDEIISSWTAQRSQLEAFRQLQAAGISAGPLLDDEGLTGDPHLEQRGWFRPLDSGDVGTHPHPGPAWSGLPLTWRRGSPTLGEDNDYVYKKILEVSDEDYERYTRERMLATDYLRPDGTPY